MAYYKIQKGINIPLAGAPEKSIIDLTGQSKLKIHPNRIKGIKPKLLVKEGDLVNTGSILFFDKVIGDVKFVSPITGKIKSIKLGERRVIEEICIESSTKFNEFLKSPIYTSTELNKLNKSKIIPILLESGCWSYLRQRPYSKIANPQDIPKAIFISGFQSTPHAPDFSYLINEDEPNLQAGIDVLSKLTDGVIHFSTHTNQQNSVFSKLKNVEHHEFNGPHPAGNIGIQIHHIDPINIGEKVWYIDIQDVIAIGHQFLTGKYLSTKYITFSGEGIKKPSYAKVKRGTILKSIIGNNLNEGQYRIVSGDVLSGDKVDLDSGLGYYHNQITVIPEGGKREFLGWLKPGFDKYTLSNTFFSRFRFKKEWSLNTSVNGDLRAIIPFGYWENVLPMDIIPNFLIRSILAKDIEEMEQLGIYECDEEDFALCSFVCQSKLPVHKIVRDGLEFIEKEG